MAHLSQLGNLALFSLLYNMLLISLSSETDNVSHFIVQCDLFSPNHKEDRNVVYNPASINPAYPNSSAAVMTFEEPTPVRNFLGTIVSNAHQLLDLEDRLGIFFHLSRPISSHRRNILSSFSIH